MRFMKDDTKTEQSAALGPCMKVIGAGLPRCATSSLQAALESQSISCAPCMHMAHVAPNATRCQIVIDAMQEKDTQKRRKLLHKIFDGYQATTDFPGFWFIDDLMDMYPDAAVVLNQRSGGGEAWFRSLQENIGFFGSWQYLLTCLPIKTDRLHWTIHQTAKKEWRNKFSIENSPGFYDVYQDFVLQEAKKRGREVLVWKAQDGWEPLCKFLGKEVPKDEPFPWVNDAATMTMLKRILIVRGVVSWMAILGGAYATWRFWPQILGQGMRGVGVLRSMLKLN